MKLNRSILIRTVVLITFLASLTALSNRLQADTGNCGGVTITLPFNDVMTSPFFCQIAAAYFSGLTNGTSATAYSPGATVTREQMAAFITRTMDQSLKRDSQRAVTKKWWTPQNANNLMMTDVGDSPELVEFDGTDLWLAHQHSATVMRIRPGDGKVLDTWTGATSARAIICAMGKVFITGTTNPGSLYMIDPTQPAGAVTTVTSSLGNEPVGIAFDGSRIWTANAIGNSVSIVSLNPTSVTTISTGFNGPLGLLFDGANIWVTNVTVNTLLKLNSDGSIAQTIATGATPRFPVFDGTNIWVPNSFSDSVIVVRVKDASGNPLTTPFVLATLTGNGISLPMTAAFDGERILVTNFAGHSVSLWKAADLTPLGSFPTGINNEPQGACSDGLNFWLTFPNTDKLGRF
jgi:DNA-binding beta-propeller fold protein YncE